MISRCSCPQNQASTSRAVRSARRLQQVDDPDDAATVVPIGEWLMVRQQHPASPCSGEACRKPAALLAMEMPRRASDVSELELPAGVQADDVPMVVAQMELDGRLVPFGALVAEPGVGENHFEQAFGR